MGKEENAYYEKEDAYYEIEDVSWAGYENKLRAEQEAEGLMSSRKPIKSGYVIKVTETDNDNTYSPTYVNGDSWQSKEPQIFETEEDAQEQAEDFRKYLNKRVRSLGGRWQYKLEIVKSSRKSIKSGISPEQNKFNWAYNDWFGHFQMNLDRVPQYLEGVKWCDANKGTSEYEQLCKKYNCYPVGDREKASFYNALKQVGAITSSKKSIKSDFNPYYEKHPDTPVGYLLGGEADTVTDADKKAADEYGLFYEGYGTMDGTEEGHLFIGKYSDIKSYFEDYMGHSLADDYIYPYEDSFGQHILDRFEIEMTWTLPTEQDYREVVDKLNNYVAKEYSSEFGPGSIYYFNMYKGERTNTDGYGHEYPNYIIFDTECNLDLFSGDEIVQYIDNLLAEKGWYHEAVSGSDNFTIAVNTN